MLAHIYINHKERAAEELKAGLWLRFSWLAFIMYKLKNKQTKKTGSRDGLKYMF